MKTQIYDVLPNEDYHARDELSSSQVKTLLSNPYEYYAKLPREETLSMTLGSATHCLVLEPHLFDRDFAIEPICDARTKEGKAIKAEFAKQSEGKTVLTAVQGELARAMSSAVLASRAGTLFSEGIAEQSIIGFVEDAEGNKYPARCRPDFRAGRIIVDFKTTQDASPDGFTKAIANLAYYIQAAFYIDVCASAGIEIARFVFVAVESKAPHMVGVYDISPEWIEFGRSEYKRALAILDRIEDYSEAIYRDTLTGDFIQTLTPPSYIFYKKNAS